MFTYVLPGTWKVTFVYMRHGAAMVVSEMSKPGRAQQYRYCYPAPKYHGNRDDPTAARHFLPPARTCSPPVAQTFGVTGRLIVSKSAVKT